MIMKDVISIIPARGGSKGVPGKNIRSLGGYPLIAYSIVASKLCKNIQRTIVSTDSEEIANIAKRFGAEVPFLRPSEIANDRSPDIDFVLHAISWFESNEGKVPEHFVHLRPTTPLRDPLVVDRAIEQIVDNSEATSLRSGHAASESPFKWFRRDDKGLFRGLMSDMSNDELNAPRQSFSVAYIPDGYVDVLKTRFIKTTGQLHGDKMLGFVSPFCTEVDIAEDLEFLEYELQKKGNILTLRKYLQENF